MHIFFYALTQILKLWSHVRIICFRKSKQSEYFQFCIPAKFEGPNYLEQGQRKYFRSIETQLREYTVCIILLDKCSIYLSLT